MKKKRMRETVKQRAMRRVVAVYYLKKVINMYTLKLGMLTLMALAFGSLVHVAAVFGNMPQITDISALVRFMTDAFLSTGIAVQTVVLASGATALWLMKDVVKALHIPQLKLSHA